MKQKTMNKTSSSPRPGGLAPGARGPVPRDRPPPGPSPRRRSKLMFRDESCARTCPARPPTSGGLLPSALHSHPLLGPGLQSSKKKKKGLLPPPATQPLTLVFFLLACRFQRPPFPALIIGRRGRRRGRPGLLEVTQSAGSGCRGRPGKGGSTRSASRWIQ